MARKKKVFDSFDKPTPPGNFEFVAASPLAKMALHLVDMRLDSQDRKLERLRVGLEHIACSTDCKCGATDYPACYARELLAKEFPLN